MGVEVVQVPKKPLLPSNFMHFAQVLIYLAILGFTEGKKPSNQVSLLI